MTYRGYPSPPEGSPENKEDGLLIQRYEYTEGIFSEDAYATALLEYARSGFTPFQFTPRPGYGTLIRFRRPIPAPRKYQELHVMESNLLETFHKLEAKGWEVVSVRPGRLTSVHAVMVTARQRVIG